MDENVMHRLRGKLSDLDASTTEGASSRWLERKLTSMLDALDAQGSYRIARTLKDAGYEITQLVYAREDVSDIPFVRKVFMLDTGRGLAYERLFRAQKAGVRFDYQPKIYECKCACDSFSVVMEYLTGETLARLVEREGPSEALAVDVGKQLCRALTELHEKLTPPIIHRDVKPSNIMLCRGKLYLIDLGIARSVRAHAHQDTVRFGTPGYAPPEQFGYGQTDVRSDVYAAGMVLAYCFTGEDPSPTLREGGFCDDRIPMAFRATLAKATAFDPNARFTTAQALGDAWE